MSYNNLNKDYIRIKKTKTSKGYAKLVYETDRNKTGHVNQKSKKSNMMDKILSDAQTAILRNCKVSKNEKAGKEQN